jgi:hypothetical protein
MAVMVRRAEPKTSTMAVRHAEPFQAACIVGPTENGGLARLQMKKPGTKGLAAMDREPKRSHDADDTTLERAIVLQLLRDDHERKWSRAQLTIELEADGEEIDREAIDEAVRRLEREGVLGCTEQEVWASDAARRLDELDLIGV